jgi:hypothetical protein
VEYSPIASPGQNEWHTDAFAAETLVEFPWLNTRTETMARLAQQVTNNEHPLRAWLGNLRRSPRRRVVVAYGKGNWPYYEALLSHVNAQWEDLHIAPEALPARYKSDGTTLVLLVYGPSAHIGAAQGRPARAWHNEHWHRLGFFVRDWLQQA